MAKKKEMSYDEALAELQQIMLEIESEDIGIDELTGKIKLAASLIKTCKQKLFNAQKEIEDELKSLEGS